MTERTMTPLNTKLAAGPLAPALLAAALLGAPALAQQESTTATDAPASADAPAPLQTDEEVIVRGRSPAALRMQIELAEDAVFARFNEINSNDDFDIRCRQEVYTGSRVPHRVCLPNLWRDAQREAGEETVRSMQGSNAFDAAQFLAEAKYKYRQMEEELRQLIRDDPELLESIQHLARLTELASDRDRRGNEPLKTVSEVFQAADKDLPYGAAAMANVGFGDKPWRHTLTHPVFTIANLFGEIRDMELTCDSRSKPLEYEQGVEWTAPEGASACSVTVEARPGTTFSLFEFD